MQKGLVFSDFNFSVSCIGNLLGLTPDELKDRNSGKLSNLLTGLALCWMGFEFSLRSRDIMDNASIFRQRASHKAEIERVCAERDKYQKQCGVEIESSDE